MIHRLLFSAKNIVAKSSIALLLAVLMASLIAVPAFATGGSGVLHTSGYADGYHYDCTYTPTHNYHDSYHVTCKYTNLYDSHDVQVYNYKHKDASGHHGKHVNNNHNNYHNNHNNHGHHGHHRRGHCVYTVQLGDNLSTIAAQYGVSFIDLAHMNHLQYPYYLYAGNVLRVPCHHY